MRQYFPESGLVYPRKLFAVFLCAGGTILGWVSFAASPAFEPNATSATSKMAPWVVERTVNGQQAEFLVVLRDQVDLKTAAAFKTKVEKGRHVRKSLWDQAQNTQASVLQWLRDRNIEHRSFYIVNAIWVKGGLDVAAALAARPDVLRVEGNPEIRNIPDPVPTEHISAARSESVAAVEVGITQSRSPEVWALGYTGQGIIVGGADTGYQWDHPALKNRYRGWNGLTADHDYNWHDSIHAGNGPCGANSSQPCDDQGHGTHTMGTAVGDDGGNNKIGMAPGAKWIGCRNMNQGVGKPATYIECMEFFLAPYPVNGTPAEGNPDLAPDVTINSWGCPASEGCSVDTLQAAVEAQRAAGIMMVVAAGNEGPACSTVAVPPGTYDAVYSVGALLTGTDALASFSSRGPVARDKSFRLKPDISAPGTSIRSSIPRNSYAYLSGTSMATPHVAGAVALLWSAQPILRRDVSQTETILNETAFRFGSSFGCDAFGAWPNNNYGYGILNVKSAVDRALALDPRPNLAPSLPAGWSDKIVVSNVGGTSTDTTNLIPADTIHLDWALSNRGTGSAGESFGVELYVDDAFRFSWTVSPPLNPGELVSIEDYNLGSLGIGTHILRIKTDAGNSVDEANETDNEYTRIVTVRDQRSYTITTNAFPNDAGVVTAPGGLPANGIFAAGASHTLVATSNPGFVFVNWTENANVVSTGQSYPFMVEANRNLVANFTAIPTPTATPTITISASPALVAEGGTGSFTAFASRINDSRSISVNYVMGGKALNGIDYSLSGVPGRITIPPGASSATVTLNALPDATKEKREKATMTLRPGADYRLPRRKTAAMTIANVPPTPTPAPSPGITSAR